jgi:uncharacterized membrane protein
VRWISLGVLAAAGVVLALCWGDVPDRWITHWGVHGPDGWAMKSALAAAAPLLIGLATWVVFEAAAFLIGRVTVAVSPHLPPEMMAVQTTALRVVGLGIAILMAGLALALPLLRPTSATPIVVAAVADLGIVIAIAIIWSARRTRQLREAGVAIPAGYQGLFYRNPRDPRLWVPKTSGLGSTLNFAHRLAWPVLLALVGGPLAVILLVSLLSR